MQENNMLYDPGSNRRDDSRVVFAKWATGYDRVNYWTLRRTFATGNKNKQWWNIYLEYTRGLSSAGKPKVIEKLVEIIITELTETHSRIKEHFTTSNDNLVISPSTEGRPVNGVALIIIIIIGM